MSRLSFARYQRAQPVEAGAHTGNDLFIIDGLCLDGWAYVEFDALGDSQLIVRDVGGRWEPYTYFPSFRCRQEVIREGLPGAILDRVGWMCEGETNGSWDGMYATEPATGVLLIGHEGDRVRELQLGLVDNFSLLDPQAVDGRFGIRTAAAVEIFQSFRSLEADGLAGPNTLAALGIAAPAAGVAGPAPGVDCTVDAFFASNPDDPVRREDLLFTEIECHSTWAALRLWVESTPGDGGTCYESVLEWDEGWISRPAGSYCFTLCFGDYLRSGMPPEVADEFATC